MQNSKIQIYDKTPFSNDYENIILFNNENEQNIFFEKSNLLNKIYESKTYNRIKRQDNSIRVGSEPETLQHATYLRYFNEKEDKWYYAFIVAFEFVQNNVTNIIYEIDVVNTHLLYALNQEITGHIVQETTKSLSLNTQGFAVGEKTPYYIEPIPMPITWYVIELLPSAKVTDKDNGMFNYGIINNLRFTRFFIIPSYKNSTFSLPISVTGRDSREVKTYSISDILKHLTNKFEGKINTVNQLVHAYTTKSIGLEYKAQLMEGSTQTVKGVELPNNNTQQIFVHAKTSQQESSGGNSGSNGSNSGSNGGGSSGSSNTGKYEKPQKLYNIARNEYGYSHASAIGVCANVNAESDFNENLNEHSGGGGYGLGQWTPKDNLYSQGATLGFTKAECETFETQCRILLQGDKTGQWLDSAYVYDPLVKVPLSLSQYKKETDIYSATMNYMAHWERPSYDPSVNHKERRKSFAKDYDENLKK